MMPRRIPFLAVAFLVAAAPLSQAVTFLIDLGANSASSSYATGTWNTYSHTSIKVASVLKDSANNTTTVGFVGAGTINTGGSPGSGTYNTAGIPSGLSWLATPSAPAAADDWLYTNNTTNGDVSHTYTFSNLIAGNVFSLDLVSSRNTGTAKGLYAYSLDGGSSWIGFNVVDSNGVAVTSNGWGTNTTYTQTFDSQTQGYSAFRYMNASNVTLTGDKLMVLVQDVGNDLSYAGANAMRLTVVPEPGTAILSLLGLGIAAFRRKR